MVLASVDPPEVQLGMNRTWHLTFPWVSDPDGVRLARPLGAWDDNASILRPVVVVVAPDGRQVFHEVSRDFADRPDDEPVVAALEGLDLPALTQPPEPWAPEGVEPRPSERAFTPERFVPYFRGIKFNTTALAGRMVDERDKREVHVQTGMAASFLEAFDAWRAEHPPDRR